MKFVVLSFLALFTFSHAAKIKISGSWFEKMTVLSQDGTTYKTFYTPISNKSNKNDKFNKGERQEKERQIQKSHRENGNSGAHIQVPSQANIQTQISKEETKKSDSNINIISVEMEKKQKQLIQETKNTSEEEAKQIISVKDDTNKKQIESPKIQITTIQLQLNQDQKKSKGQEASINLVESQPDIITPVKSNLKEETTISVEPKEVDKDEIIKQEQLSSAFPNENQIKQTPIDKQQVLKNLSESSSIQSSQKAQKNQAQPAVSETKIVASGVETVKQGKIIDAARKKVQQMISSKMSATASPFSMITPSDNQTSSQAIDKDGNYVSDSTNRVQGKDNYVDGTYNNVTGVKNSVENGHYNDIQGHFNKIVNGTNNVVSGNGAFIIGSNNKVYSS